MEQPAHFGAWLKQQRKARRMTQEDLASRLACSAVLVQKIEAGERNPSTQLVALIGDWLDIPSEDGPAFLRFARNRTDSPEPKASYDNAFPLAEASLAATSSYQSNLPNSLTSLVGRGGEIEVLKTLLVGVHEAKATRLVTLTGPPGIGKTRLALQVANEVREYFKDGVFFVGLAAVSDPDMVAATIAEALGLADNSADSLLISLQQWLSGRQVLLLLDNFEQVLDASPSIVELLGTCSQLKVLATSREAFHVYGEQQYPVPPLATADPANLPPIPALESIPSVALFMERARAVKPGFFLTEQNAGAVAAICARLDGLPLAIELAAARIRLLSPQELENRLDARLPLLTGGPRNMPPRQRTLRAAIDWSYNLLTGEEQVLFARLGVFVGGCTLAAVQAVCGTRNGDIPHSDISSAQSLDLSDSVESLLDKNLLKRQEGGDGASRFTMLEMLREYAVGCLERGGESDVIGRSHTEYYLALAEAAEPALRGPHQSAWVKRLEQEHDNMRAALRWTEAKHEPVLHLRLALALWWFWIVRGHINEASRWLVGSVDEEAIETPLRARALYAAGVVAWAKGDIGRSETYLQESLTLYRETANALGVGQALRIIANLARDRGDYAASRLYYEQSFDAIEEAQDAEAMALVLISMGENARGEGNYEAARSYYERSVEISCDFESGHTMAIALFNLGLIEHHEGHEQPAEELLKRSLRLHHGLRETFCIAECLYGLGGVASTALQTDRAVRLLAAADVLFHSTGYQQNSIDRQGNDHEISKVRSMVDRPTFERLWAEGQTMSVEQAVAYALDEAHELV